MWRCNIENKILVELMQNFYACEGVATPTQAERDILSEREAQWVCVWVCWWCVVCGGLAACQTHWRVCLCKQEVLRCRHSVKTNTQTDRQIDARGVGREAEVNSAVYAMSSVLCEHYIYIHIYIYIVCVLHGSAQPSSLAPFLHLAFFVYLSTLLVCFI